MSNGNGNVLGPAGWVSLLAPAALQVVALIMLALIVIFRDGADSELVIQTLIVVAGANAIGGVGVGITHQISVARTNTAIAQAQVDAIKSGATPASVGVTPAPPVGNGGIVQPVAGS